MRGTVVTAALAVLLFPAAAAFSQTDEEINAYIQKVRSEVRRDKTAAIGSAMGFTGDEAAKFWPIYKDFEGEMTKWGDARIDLVKDYAANFEKMTDAKASDLAGKALDQEQKRLDLLKKYYTRISKEMTPTIAARFIQVERRLDMLLDLQTAAEIPLVPKAGM